MVSVPSPTHLSSPAHLSGHSLGGYAFIASRAAIRALLPRGCRPVPDARLPEDDGDGAILAAPGDGHGDDGASRDPPDNAGQLFSFFFDLVRACDVVGHLFSGWGAHGVLICVCVCVCVCECAVETMV